jgi:hypothetical protein
MTAQVTRPVATKVDQLNVVGESCPQQVTRGSGEEELPAARERQQSRGALEGITGQRTELGLLLRGVEGDAQRRNFGRQGRSLEIERAGNGFGRAAKGCCIEGWPRGVDR